MTGTELISEHIDMYGRVSKAIAKSGQTPATVAVAVLAEMLARMAVELFGAEQAPEVISAHVNNWLLKIQEQA